MKKTAFGTSLGALCGFAWGQPSAPWLMAAALLVPAMWGRSSTRLQAWATVFAYYLATSRGLPLGTGIFFENTAPLWFGWALWIISSLVNASLWGIFWHPKRMHRAWILPLILIATSLPPFGLLNWTHPIVASGVILPGFGFLGLSILIALYALTVNFPRVATATVILMSGFAHSFYQPIKPLPHWKSIDTHFGKLASGSNDFVSAFERILYVREKANALPSHTVLVLPETLLGTFTEVTRQTLRSVEEQLRQKESIILVGAEIQSGKKFKNVLIALGTSVQEILVQRVPVPIGMWRPWSDGGTESDILGKGIAQIANVRLAYLICYEQLLVFPVLYSMASNPQILIGAANNWWARNTSIPIIQRQSLEAWGSLFSVPVTMAVNL